MRWPLMKNAISEDERRHLCDFIMTTDRYTQGPRVEEFEKKWCDWLGCKYSLMVSSGSTANFLLIASVKELYNIPNGSKVLVPACTWVTNVSPVFQNNLEPVFCDINLDNFSFDENDLPDPELVDIKLIFVTYLLGFDYNLNILKKKYPNAIIIEDICESHGVKDSEGNKKGSDSVGSTFSFYFGHHMTTIEGGMISTNNKDLYNLMKIKRSHGMARNLDKELFEKECAKYPDLDPKFLFLTDGYNFRSSDLNAVIGIEQLKHLDESIKIRNKNFKIFVDVLNTNSNKFHTFRYNENDSNFAFPIICYDTKKLAQLKKTLDENEIEYRPIVSGNLLRHPFLKKWFKEMKNADIINNNGLYIGNNQFVNDDDMELLKDILNTV